ncbi:MAG: hypothetical protein KC518_14050 [Candidatus Cloacimonetes bacterium]|nr:hypothetical protein [Candidatus Cloacimonadota bacterium]
MKALTDTQSVRARDWIRALGEQKARSLTAAHLAYMLNQEDGVDCYTPAHMAARRQQVFPLRERRADPVKDLQDMVQKLSRRVGELERTVEAMKQSRLPLAG